MIQNIHELVASWTMVLMVVFVELVVVIIMDTVYRNWDVIMSLECKWDVYLAWDLGRAEG